MREITKKLHDKHYAEFLPVIEQMAKEGATEDQIIRAYQAHLRTKTSNYYNRTASQMAPLQSVVESCLRDARPGSKAEVIFYQILIDADINFRFQFPIGPYTVDFLIAGFLVLEIDGPQHDKNHDEVRDKYMRNMGYKILRVPLHILCACPEAVIEEIQEAMKIKRVK